MFRLSNLTTAAFSVRWYPTTWLKACIVGLLVALYSGAMFAMSVLAIYAMTVKPAWDIYSATKWVKTRCTIVSSDVAATNHGDFGVQIEYSYSYAGKHYAADRYDFVRETLTTWRPGKQKIVDRYRPGTQAVCYVDPADPRHAVLNRGLTAGLSWGLFALVMAFFAACGLGIAARAILTSKLPSLAYILRSAEAKSTISPAGENGNQPCALEPDPSLRSSKILLVAVTCGVAILLAWVFGSPNSPTMIYGHPIWTFESIGLWIMAACGIAWIGYRLLAMCNPRPELQLSRGRLPLGGQAGLSWRFVGNTNGIRRLTLELAGTERAWCHGGIGELLEETFYRETVYETGDPLLIPRGTVEIKIPARTMHSFRSPHNAIVWSVRVLGQIPMRPNVNFKFPLQVLPHESTAH